MNASRSRVSAGFTVFSTPIVETSAVLWVAAQKLPNPWVGQHPGVVR